MLAFALLLAAQEDVGFDARIRPLLAAHCLKCHGPEKHKGGLRLDLRQAAFHGGDSSDHVIVPGKSKDSELLRRILSTDPDLRMPPEGPRVAAGDVDLLRRWIDAGAAWPADAAAPVERKISEEERGWWAFRPVTAPPVPTLQKTGWIRSPIDAFVLARLEREGLEPAPEASREVLIRRATFDLTGLPPTPEELASGESYEQAVDRLLASPRYGERWGQHWLDVVRFGESEGFEYDTPVTGLWRFRDWVIASFNADKPFDRFVAEQVAGDEIAPEDRDHLVAAGFHRLGPVRRNAGNQEVAGSRNEVLTDRTDILGAAFLGMTFGCARCHDHKFDPILQKDYYRLQAFLAGTDQRDLSLATPEEEAAWKEKAEAIQKEIAALKKRKKAAPEEDGAVLNAKIEALEDRLPAPLPSITTIRNLPEPTPIHVLRRGEWSRKGDLVGPRFPSALVADGSPELSTSGTRTRLARWLVDRENPLTARVYVNRVWQGHFGTGLVKTANDFGKNGERPSHPELLDHLATSFLEDGGRTKPLHRRILLSAAYRQSSASPRAAEGIAKDPDDRLLWRFPRRRLSAEEIRDAMLAVAGRLNLKAGGPSVFLPVDPELVSALYKPLQWAVTPDPAEHDRRSVYLVAKRNLRLPSMEVFDQPSLGSSCGRRECSTHAPQALELMNGKTSNRLAEAFAARLAREKDPVEAAFRLALGRGPTAAERGTSTTFLKTQPLREFALAVFNLNGFLYVD